MSQTILDRPIKGRPSEVSLSAFGFLFSAIIQHTHSHPTPATTETWEARLNEVGYRIGVKVLDLAIMKAPKRVETRETELIPALAFLQTRIWEMLFGESASNIERLTEDGELRYVIVDSNPIISKYICNTPDQGDLSICAFAGGVIQGYLESAGFPAKAVRAYNVGDSETRYLIEFYPHVLRRAGSS
eukprot:Sspe_Gene.7977::Locus_2707_Transcript_8_10_Confidence_0.095_Length_1035::g.7977::m.7977/K20280/TRAPPC5, TRS31; trafficking protein particle complex subunit 5